MNVHSFFTRSGFEVQYIGPQLKTQPLPAVIYFALSASDSLLLDPFNQPVEYLKDETIRIFSVTIPGHENQLPKEKALEFWAKKVENNKSPLFHFFEEVKKALEELRPYFLEEKIALCGLSRGGFIALHLASQIPWIKTILAFAPLIRLDQVKEFSHLKTHPIVKDLNIDFLIDHLIDKNIRIYIGNRDLRVGTEHSFHLITTLANAAYEKRVKNSSFEMTIGSSIGYLGHGTSLETFQKGCQWLKTQLAL